MTEIVENFPDSPIKERLLENKRNLYIKRIPKHIKETFIKIAEQKYCDDYGMLLTILVDRYLKEEKNGIRRD